MKPVIEAALTLLAALLFILFTSYLFLEWAAGCGESYTDAKGRVHTNECVFNLINR